MAISVPLLMSYIDAELNVIITGQAGTGKTEMLMQACEELGLVVKYYSASTLDPFADLVGIPVPNNETRKIEFWRPDDVNKAQVIIFDELNRAEEKTKNAVFEITQFHTINGEPLPNLLCVVAAINPVEEGYDTDELDIALWDRFDIYLESEVVADYNYFKKKYGAIYARLGIEMFKDYQKDYKNAQRSDKNTIGYFSPRRLDKLMGIFKKFPNESTFKNVLPSDVTLDSRGWTTKFNHGLAEQKKMDKSPETVEKPKPVSTAIAIEQGGDSPDQIMEKEKNLKNQKEFTANQLRASSNAPLFVDAYRYAESNSPNDAQLLLTNLSSALNKGVGPESIKTVWGDVLFDFNERQQATMMAGWVGAKHREMRDIFLDYKAAQRSAA